MNCETLVISEREFNWLVVFAFRYAVGRHSTAPGMVADLIIKYKNLLDKMSKDTIKEEITWGIEGGHIEEGADRDVWMGVLNEL